MFNPFFSLNTIVLTRIATPIFKGVWRFFTNADEKEREEKRAREEADFNRKVTIQRISHEFRIKEAREAHKLAIDEWAKKIYYERCWPLRNPFEMLQICTPVSDGGSKSEKEFIPCRLITALKDSDHPYARTINGNLSSFVVNNFATNSQHAVISEIGAWKDDVPSNDASITYLYAGLKKQPVFVLSPTFIHGGKTVIFKAWSWGLGEDLNYPAGFEFGRLDMIPLFQRALYEETIIFERMNNELGGKAKFFSPQLQHNLDILKKLRDKNLSKTSRERLIMYIMDAPETVERVQTRMENTLSGVFCCIAGMYADAYHLLEYNTAPKLPQLICDLPGVYFMLPSLKEYYFDLLSMMEKLDYDKKLISKIYLEVADSFSKLDFSFENRNSIIEPFLTKALALHLHSLDESVENMDNLSVISLYVKSTRGVQNTEMVKRANEILNRVKISSLC